MANCETINLPVLELEPHQVREALRCVLHTIIFNRSLGYVVPKDVDSELFDITYVQCGDPGVAARVEGRVGEFCAAAERRPAELHQLHLSFYETRRRQAWFSAQDERLVWEQWVISVLLLAPDPSLTQPAQPAQSALQDRARASRLARLAAGVEAAIAAVVRAAAERRDHLPPLQSQAAAVTFPFDITFSGSSSRAGGLGGGLQAVGKMLLRAQPPPVLG